MNFDLVMGDETGYFHMQDSQRMYIEYDEFSVLRSAPPANLIIDSGSEMWASADFKIIGAASTAFEVLYHKTIFVAVHIHYLKVSSVM